MNAVVHTAPFQCFAVTAAILVLNLLFLAGQTAATRGKSNGVLNPEDKRLNANAQVVNVEDDATARWQRAHRNALENIPPYLAVGLLLALTEPSAMIADTLFTVFTVARLAHSVCYVKGIQPWRTASFGIAALALAAISIYAAIGTLM